MKLKQVQQKLHSSVTQWKQNLRSERGNVVTQMAKKCKSPTKKGGLGADALQQTHHMTSVRTVRQTGSFHTTNINSHLYNTNIGTLFISVSRPQLKPFF